MGRGNTEIELKFAVRPARVAELRAWIERRSPAPARTLSSVYFDTPDQRLRKAGYVLRVRDDGAGPIQTVKSREAPDGRIGRGEWESPVADGGPDLSAARRTPAGEALPRRARLLVQFGVEAERLQADVTAARGLIEVSLDHARVTHGGREIAWDELELELKAGPPAALFALARELQPAFALDLSVSTKAERGQALAEGRLDAPHRFERPRLSRKMSVGVAFQAMARAGLAQVVANAETFRASPSAEAVHQMRVGARRLRATLAAFKAVTSDSRRGAILTRLRELARGLDATRNLDVFIARLQADAAAPPPGLIDRLVAAREVAYGRALASVDSARARRLFLDALAWIETGPWTGPRAAEAEARDEPIRPFARALLRKARRRVVEAGPDLAGMTPEARHDLRIHAKRLRYAADVLDQLFDDHPRRGRRFLTALGDLLDTLGGLNDIATAGAMLADFGGWPEMVAREAAEEAARLAAAETAYAAFRAAAPFWRHRT